MELISVSTLIELEEPFEKRIRALNQTMQKIKITRFNTQTRKICVII